MRADRFAAALLLSTFTTALAPASAQAFCRTRTVPAPANFDSTTGCFEQGLPLYHASQCVPYRLLAKESPRIPNAVISTSLGRAFGAWTSGNAFCTPGLTPIELAPSAGTTIVGYTTGERGNNIVGVVDGPWPHSDGSETLSLTTLTFNADSGEVYDADLEIRSDVDWSLGATPPPDGFDFDAVMTHETGHFLGLAHSQHGDAVMWSGYTPGSVTQRTLSDDDKQGMCAIYPDRQTRSTGAGNVPSTLCNLSPGTPGATTPCGDPDITHGCSMGPSRSSSPSLLVVIATAGLMVLRTRRRRA